MPKRSHILEARDRKLEVGSRTRVMGVVNVTPDSFFDGGRFFERSKAVERCLELVDQGADLLDLGGESSRPGAESVPAETELERVLPVLQAVRKEVSVPISVDTYKADVARVVLQEGADIINDVSAFRFDRDMPRVVREAHAGVILMHMRGAPENMQQLPPSSNILKEVEEDLRLAVSKAVQHGIGLDRIMIDPGIGFGKTHDDNCKILNRLSFLDSFQLPIVVGTSRKSFIGKILNRPVENRLWGTAATVAVAILRGAHIVRLHDVEEMNQVTRVTDAIRQESISHS